MRAAPAVSRSQKIDQECVEAYIFSGVPANLLIFQRPPERGRVWVPVSGKVESLDRNLADATRREIREETGFEIFLQFFPLNWVVVFDGPGGGRWRLHAFGVELPSKMSPRLSAEHRRFEWVGLEEARSRLSYDDNRRAVDRLDKRLAGSMPRSPRIVLGERPNL